MVHAWAEWSFLGLMDLGVSPTLTRRLAFPKGKSGRDPGLLLSRESQRQIADLVATGRLIFRPRISAIDIEVN